MLVSKSPSAPTSISAGKWRRLSELFYMAVVANDMRAHMSFLTGELGLVGVGFFLVF